MMKILLISLAVLLVLPNFIDLDINGTVNYNGRERFDPSLTRINSISLFESYTDSLGNARHITTSNPLYWIMVDSVISNRFYHGFSHYTLRENWLAALGDKILGHGLSNKVKTADIIQNAQAACSQQAGMMIKLCRLKKVAFRSVGFPHHYAMELALNNDWFYFDADMEPELTMAQRQHSSWNGNSDFMKNLYSGLPANDRSYLFGNGQQAHFGVVNEVPAQRLKYFHSITYVLSRTLFLIPLLLLLWIYVRKPQQKTARVTPIKFQGVYSLGLNSQA